MKAAWTGWLLCAGLLAVSPALAAQPPGAAIPDAMHTRLLAGRGCGSPLLLSDTSIACFPGVRFVIGRCEDEHGDTDEAMVALDADSSERATDSTFSCAAIHRWWQTVRRRIGFGPQTGQRRGEGNSIVFSAALREPATALIDSIRTSNYTAH